MSQVEKLASKCRREQVDGLGVTIKKCGDDQDNVSDDCMFMKVKRLSENAVVPSVSSPNRPVYDLFSASETTIPGLGKAVVHTDLSMAIPDGYTATISTDFPLPGEGIIVEARGIKNDFRGPINVTLLNKRFNTYVVKKGCKVAQLILSKTNVSPEVVEVECLDETVVDKWCRKSGVKLEPQVKEMLEKTLVDYPEAGADCLKWVLHGWNMRGDKNLVDLKSALCELIRSNLSLQNKFEITSEK